MPIRCFHGVELDTNPCEVCDKGKEIRYCWVCCSNIIRLENLMECSEKNLMREKSCCFSCAFWFEKVEWAKNPSEKHRIVRVNGKHYHIGPEPTPEQRSVYGMYGRYGCGGAKFTIKFMDDGTEVVTHNMWCQGIIPEHFREQLPDNAEFVNKIATPPSNNFAPF